MRSEATSAKHAHTVAVSGHRSIYHRQQQAPKGCVISFSFWMLLHYPRYKKVDYEAMLEWRVD
jgi:hypothetical protein